VALAVASNWMTGSSLRYASADSAASHRRAGAARREIVRLSNPLGVAAMRPEPTLPRGGSDAALARGASIHL